MTTLRTIESIEHNDLSVVTVGTFDGLHRGHRSIIERLHTKANEIGGKSVVVTFDPHPQIVLNSHGREPIKLLTSMSERLKLLSQTGVSTTIVIPFTFEFAQTSAEEFIRDYLCQRIGAKHILIGFDHMFGKNRSGNDDILQSLSETLAFTVERIPPLQIEINNSSVKISSTQIRNALKNSDILLANSMLGYSYSLEGVVVEGDGRGRRLGYPTANIECMEPHKLLPKNGVYLVSSKIDGETYFGMANIGTRPTFTDDSVSRLEVHYFSLNAYLYDRRLAVEFHEFIRPEMKFESIDLFWSQLQDDRDTCHELISKNSYD